MRIRTVLLVTAILATLSGCGLDIMVMSDPTVPQQGEDTDFTVMVKNQTQCTVTDTVLVVVTFIAPRDLPPTVNFCDLIQDTGIAGTAQLEEVLGRVFSSDVAAQVMQSAQNRFFGSSEGSGQLIYTCMPVGPGTAQGNGSDTLQITCNIGTIDPMDKVTVAFTAPAPVSGPIRTIALALGDVPSDEDCRPGVPELGRVAGCFDSSAGIQPAPVVSFAGLAATVVALLGVGAFAITRRRR